MSNIQKEEYDKFINKISSKYNPQLEQQGLAIK